MTPYPSGGPNVECMDGWEGQTAVPTLPDRGDPRSDSGEVWSQGTGP